MTLTAAAIDVLSATESGCLETAEQPLLELGRILTAGAPREELGEALSILREARNAMYAHRAHILDHLRQLERTTLYSGETSAPAISWTVSG